jgi:hypothetical protein
VKTYAEFRDQVLHDPAAHDTLKRAVRDFDTQDPVDAYRDVRFLLWLEERRLKECSFA